VSLSNPMQSSPDDPEVARLIAHGAAGNPGIREPPALRELLATRIAKGVRELETRAADLYLAAACVAGDPAAIAVLDARLPTIVRPSLARLGFPVSDDDEIVQRVRVALLVRNDEGVCGLAGYTGRGELRSYVRAVAVRIALKRRQRETAAPPDNQDEIIALLPDAGDSPELAQLKKRCRSELRTIFASALAALTPRERTLLRQHYVDGLTVDVLGQLHQVHRSTCARWLEAARIKILRTARSHLRTTLGLDATALDSAIALVRSQLDLSLSRHLMSRS
jgi:RNA polymerase sigma-70 factor, ECF subfamily